jgi:hypothetical protein
MISQIYDASHYPKPERHAREDVEVGGKRNDLWTAY